MSASSLTTTEIETQPECWERAVALAPGVAGKLPRHGERVAVIGCGTSWFMAQSYAALRERAGHGETDAFAASEFPFGRAYDRVLAITRSGTTTEVLRACERLRGSVPVTALTADPATPVMTAAGEIVVLDFADEESVVQTRFATTVLALLRAHLGEDLSAAVADARRTVTADLAPALLAAEQFTFLGTGWTYGLAQEAALKMREAAGAWTEAYPAMEYRHGPISITGPGRAVFGFGVLPEGLAASVAAVGGHLEDTGVATPDGSASVASGATATPDAPEGLDGPDSLDGPGASTASAGPATSGTSGTSGTDPLAALVLAQRLAVALAEAKGYDPDKPRNLTRSVVLA